MNNKLNTLELGKPAELHIGIDLGTTNCAVTVATGSSVPKVVSLDSRGSKTMQSCILWLGGDKFVVGREAYDKRYLPNACYSVKRMMGSEESITLTLPETGETKVMTPAEVSALILKELHDRTARLYGDFTKCVITIPAYFNQRQIKDTLEAAKLAGLEPLELVKEPTSSAFIYSELGYAQTGSVLVYDVGGGTSDVTVMDFLRLDRGVDPKQLSFLKSAYGIEADKLKTVSDGLYLNRITGVYGDMYLGGDDIDRDVALESLKNANETLDKQGMEELVLRCEQFKKSGALGTNVIIQGKNFDLEQGMVRRAYAKLVAKTMSLIEDVDRSKIETVVLVGGTTRSPYLQELLKDAFPNADISAVLDADLTVALGAGGIAKKKANKEAFPFRDVLPLAIGVLVDETEVEFCIDKNTEMPYITTRKYYTMHDNQKALRVDLFQGTSKRVDDCLYLGSARIDNLEPLPAGEVCVNVNLILTSGGTLEVTSKIEGTDQTCKVVINDLYSAEDVQTSKNAVTDGDDFESMAFQFADSNPQIQELLAQRRDTSDAKKRAAIESKILDLI